MKEEVYEHGVHGLTQGRHGLDPEQKKSKESSMVEYRSGVPNRVAGGPMDGPPGIPLREE